MRWLIVIGLAAVVATVLGWVYWRGRPVGRPAEVRDPLPPVAPLPILPAPTATPAADGPILLVDVTGTTGVDFQAFTGTTADKHFPTANGTGVAILDADCDGLLDLYFVNSCRLDDAGQAPPNRLYRGRGNFRFEDISAPSGLAISGFTQGVQVGDVNNDGFSDVYLVRYGPNLLLENMGDGSFRDVTDAAGVGDRRWGTSAAFLDYDEDGNLDLYVANYGQWDMKWHRDHFCSEAVGEMARRIRMYCSPKLLTPEVHALYRSLGDGRFEEVTLKLGIARKDGRGQGVVACDVNDDGHIDLYVANDLTPNFLFINNGQGGFEDFTDLSGAALDSRGNVQAGMGVDAADVDGDGLPDLFVTNFFNEYNTLYRNLGNRLFQDVSHWSQVAVGSIQYVGWGTGLEDLDGDGWLDIFVGNGHVDDNLEQIGRREPYAQTSAVWRNRGEGHFEFLEGGAGPYFQTAHVSRGVGFGDLDNDGDVDVVVVHKEERPTVLRNASRERQQTPFAWYQLSLVGTVGNRDAIGARIAIRVPGRTLVRHLRGGRSYLSAHDLRVTAGLGSAQTIEQIEIRWPTGGRTQASGVSVNASQTLREPRASDVSTKGR